MAATTLATPVTRTARRGWMGTPEIYFSKHIDNSRLVKVDDPVRRREMRMFTVALIALFAMVMMYAWQHFSAIEYGYKIEALKTQQDVLTDANRQLRLDLAELRDPGRIDTMARQMGLQMPATGQVTRMEPGASDMGGPIMARANVVVISATP